MNTINSVQATEAIIAKLKNFMSKWDELHAKFPTAYPSKMSQDDWEIYFGAYLGER